VEGAAALGDNGRGDSEAEAGATAFGRKNGEARVGSDRGSFGTVIWEGDVGRGVGIEIAFQFSKS